MRPMPPSVHAPRPPRALAIVTFVLGLLALAAPIGRSAFPTSRVGWLLAFAAAIEMLHAMRRSEVAARRRAALGALISMAIALFLINAPFVASQALRLLIAGWFGIDGVRNAIAAVRQTDAIERRNSMLSALGNALVVLLLFVARGWLLTWIVAIAGALRIFGIAWSIKVTPVYATTEADTAVIEELGLADEPEAVAMAGEVETAEANRVSVDRGWTFAFIATLFAIHIGRMRVDFTFLGLISPAVAVLGDMAIAIFVTLLVINPVYLLWRGPTRWIERPVWHWHLRQSQPGRKGPIARIIDAWLRWRLRLAIRSRAARFSVPKALGLGLQNGLPIAAIIAATVPVWGMSWYFDTENWASGLWNSWAESRTDTWRDAMVRAVGPSPGFAVQPEGVVGDFSFIVIGDPGEGDASQQVLRDQILSVANQPDVRFVVISSDVVYPTGAMIDYEAKFWLQFKGVKPPIYAIPGNHDWYDALEGFAATFLQPDAARASMRARIEADLRLTSTTDDRINGLVREAGRLRTLYGVQTGFQRATFFEIQTDRFTLLAIDTGVMRTIDPAQAEWLNGALSRSAGKLTMAILGHPFYAGGHDVTTGDEDFTALKKLLIDRGVTIVMAGDTHDLEYYSEPETTAPAVHHFVNGGGGAYLSFGTALSWPDRPPTANWAYYPGRDAVTAKIEAETPWWKRPAWWWTKQFDAWPYSAEWLSAFFDYNVAPFFQSFFEVKVEPSANRVRLIPYGVNGRLTWGEVSASGAERDKDGYVEWVVPIR
jgi:uncharacterized membrane protein HdeD (DUF308 family)/3',5'-cyclic AMP phosphodiesterase CpdA